MQPTATLVTIAALAFASPWAAAQTVYRCGNSYSQQPCEGATQVRVNDPRTKAEATRASSVALADRKRADAMEKARLAQEKNAPKALIIGPQTPASAPPARKDAGKAKKKDGKAETPFTAVVPGTAAPKKKR